MFEKFQYINNSLMSKKSVRYFNNVNFYALNSINLSFKENIYKYIYINIFIIVIRKLFVIGKTSTSDDKLIAIILANCIVVL